MKFLFVTPVKQGSGETITSLHIAESLVRREHEILFLASAFARGFIDRHFPGRVRDLGDDGDANLRTWLDAVASFRPDAVVFADYPLCFVPGGCAPLVSEDPEWVDRLEELDACLVTLDHFGFAQGEMGLYLGPPHLGLHYQWFPAIPRRMRVLLPCPMHEPGPVEGRVGEPFRYWEVPLKAPEERVRETRRRYLDDRDALLVFHSVPNWAWRGAEIFGLSLYRHLPEILDQYLGESPRPVTVVSVNNGSLLAPREHHRVRLINLAPIPRAEFEDLLHAADLVLTENKVSISMGKAICAFKTSAALKNSYRLAELMPLLTGRLRDTVMAMEAERLGTVYPFEVYPTGMTELLDKICLYRDNGLTRGFRDLEMFGGEETAAALCDLLTDDHTREEQRAHQERYVERLRRLEESAPVLERLVEEEGRRR